MKSGHNRFIAVLIMILFTLGSVLTGCSSQKASPTTPQGDTKEAKREVYNIRLAEYFAPPPGGGGLAQAAQWYADEVNKRTEGRVKIEIGWSEAFGKVSEMPDLVRSGAVQMAAIGPGNYQHMPLWGILSAAPFVTSDPANTLATIWELYDTFPAMTDELKKNNIKMLYISALNPYQLLTNKPINSLADMKGLKVRSWGAMVPQMFKAAGAVPVNIMIPDSYDAFARKTLDMQVGPMDVLVGQGWYELGKYVTKVNFTSPVGASGAINLDYWNKLPVDIQKIMVDVGREHQQKLLEFLKATETAAIKTMESKGLEINDFPKAERDKWVAASPDFLNVWAEDAEKKGLPGKEYVKRFNEIQAKLKK